MAEQDPFDKLAIPPAKDPAALKLTITTIENKKKEIQKEIDDVLDGQKDNSNKIKKIINFIKAVKSQQKNNIELNKGLTQVVKEIDDFKQIVKKLDTPESVKNASQEIDGLIEDVKDHIKAHAENNEKFKKLFESHEKKFQQSSGLKSGLDNLKKIGLWFEDKATFFRRQTGMQFCSYLNNKVVKTMGGLINKAPTVNKLFGVLKGVSKVFSWLGDVGKTTIETIYNTFIKLSAIGWKVLKGVFNVITYPVKVVGGFFAQIFAGILTTPIGFLSTVLLLGAGIYFLAKPVAKLAGKLFTYAWEWVKEAFDTYFINAEKKERLINFFGTAKETIVGWFTQAWDYFVTDGRLKNAYDSTIGKVTGWSIDTLKTLFNNGMGMIQTAWDTVKKGFVMLYNSGVFDEILLLWNAIKALIYADEDIIIENLKEDNRKVISEGYTALITREAEALIQSQVLNTFFNKYNGVKSAAAIEDLVNIADSVISQYINSKVVSTDSDKNKQILSNVQLNSKQIVMSLLAYDNSRLKDIYGTSKSRELGFGKKLLELRKIDSTSDLIPDITANSLKEILGRNLNKYKYDKYESAPVSLPAADLSRASSSISQYDPSNMHFADSPDSNLPQYAAGAVVNRPTYALIGEGTSPEMVIPLNQDGLTFVYNSMKELLVDAMTADIPAKATTQDIIRRIQKGRMTKPDSKIYDLKNLSTGLIGFR